MANKQSKAWSVNRADLKKVSKNALVFLAPVVITLLTMLQAGDGNVSHYQYAFELWAAGVVLDFFRKLKAD